MPFQNNPHRNVFMMFLISAFGSEQLLLQPELRLSKLKPGRASLNTA